MCIEDFRIGRKTWSEISTIQVPDVAAEVLQGHADRVALIFSPSPEDGYYLDVQPISNTWQGFFIPANGEPLSLNIKDHGDIVRKTWFGQAAGFFTMPTISTISTTHLPSVTGFTAPIQIGAILTYLSDR